MKLDEIKMTDMQFEQLFYATFKDPDIREDENDEETYVIEPSQIETLLRAYEMWNYEHSYKQAMEELYADIDT